MTWRPEIGGKFRGNLAFRVDGRFPAQVSVVGEAIDAGGDKRRKADGRERSGKRVRGSRCDGGVGKRRSLPQEALRGAGPYTSVRITGLRASVRVLACYVFAC